MKDCIFLLISLGLSVALGLSSCLSVVTPIPLPTSTGTPSPSPTPTVAWFPPTETLKPVIPATKTPVPTLFPSFGKIIFSDDFSSPGGWSVGEVGDGSVSVSQSELNLVINEPESFVYSVLAEPKLSDFFVEITANPSLCSGKDEYGLMFRASGNTTYYRYSLSCDGAVRLDRLVGGTAFSPQPWLPSASVPSAAPSQSRLGVWAKGDELRFFINGEFQFAVTDDQIRSGSFGVFARSVGENAVTVSFTDLVVREVE
ncbi:MAG: hypothetical protein MAG431_02224 [Chloroflexi bacterium]|nr:hypothetical protein [Chloroflexota bacterium]